MSEKRGEEKILIIVGPTASGKTALSIELAKRFNGEVISADSRQVYRGLDLGTGKVTKKEMQGIPHHLIDVASPKRTYNADDFLKAGRKSIADIRKRGRLPIVAGGTGFYIDTLIGAISLPLVPPNSPLRKKLERLSVSELYDMLKDMDPRRAADIDAHNPVRLIRAIEIAEALGVSPPPAHETLYDALWIGIDIPKEELNVKIENRLILRMKRGMLAEAQRLHEEGVSWKRMEDLGLEYRYMARLLEKHITRDEFDRDLTTEIKRYAKRQRMYWRRNKEITWFSPSEEEKIVMAVQKFLD